MLSTPAYSCYRISPLFPVARGISIVVLILTLLASPLSWVRADSLSQWRKQLAQADTDKDSDSAIELARRILAADPRDTDAWGLLLQYQIENKDYGRALASLRVWEKVPKSPTAQIDDLRGQVYLAQKLPGQAEKAWRASLAAKPANYLVLSELADLLETQERWPEVLALRSRAAAAKPTAALLSAKGGALLHNHQWDAAAEAINKANAMDAADPTVQQWLPHLETLSRFLDPIKVLDKRIAERPGDFAPLLDQAALFLLADEPALALTNAIHSLKLQSTTCGSILAGAAELSLGKPLAAADFTVSHDLVRDGNGQVPPDALRDLKKWDSEVFQNPGKAEPLAARSKVLRGLKQYVMALDNARAALKADPNSPDAEFEMGHDLDALGRSREALPHIVHATELRPNDSVAWYYRGVIEANRADFHAAIASQTRSLGIRESIVALRARLDAELRLCMVPESTADLDRLHKLDPTSKP